MMAKWIRRGSESVINHQNLSTMNSLEKFTLPEIQRQEQHHLTGDGRPRPNRMMETPRFNSRNPNPRMAFAKDSDHHEEPAINDFPSHAVNRVNKT
jgi:hypothetical protein